jgi:hypothetical protein
MRSALIDSRRQQRVADQAQANQGIPQRVGTTKPVLGPGGPGCPCQGSLYGALTF